MFRRALSVLILTGSVFFAAAADIDLLASYGQLRNVAPDPSRVAVAENIVLKKDAATFRFKTGHLYFFQPVMDKVAGAVFVGDGEFSFQPPAESERKQLSRFLAGQTQMEEPFKEMVLVFTDSTYSELTAAADFKPGAVDPRASSLLSSFHKTFRNDQRTNIEARLLAGLCSARQSLFQADFHGQQHGDLRFAVDAMSGEDVSLIHYSGNSVYETWSSYNGSGTAPAAARAFADTTRIDLDTTIDKGGSLQGEAYSEFTAMQDGPRLMYVPLASSLRVSKATWSDGSALKFIQEPKDKDADFWIVLPMPLEKNAKYNWRASYAGSDVVRKAGSGNFYVSARDRWYPKLDNPGDSFNDRAMYHMIFHTPKEYTLVATGRPVQKKDDGKMAVTEWETEVPYTVAGFNFGSYKTKSVRSGDQEITVYANTQLGDELEGLRVELERNPQAARLAGISTGGLDTTQVMSSTLAQTANSLGVFTAYFGPLPFKNIAITQQPSSSYGQSWPTLIFMPYTSFLDATTRNQLGMDRGRTRDFLEEVGSHEIAHQWWGHVVANSDYHDEWLSEGFAQFSAGLYLHRTEGEKKLREFMEAQREFILNTLPESSVRANDAGPISMGARLSTEKTPGASRLIYAKGAFVLHMLRMMMYDYARADDSKFIAMMKDFVQSSVNGGASTADFKAICDKHFGADMAWFFNQWVYGTAIPKISVEYAIAEAPGGAALSMDIKQQNVPEGFRSVLPVLLRTKTGALSGKIVVSKPADHVEIKLAVNPDSVEFNPLYGLLCELDVKKR